MPGRIRQTRYQVKDSGTAQARQATTTESMEKRSTVTAPNRTASGRATAAPTK